jgi:sugar phosphate isomerase/epimerase
MRWGICTAPENASLARAAGWDYVEGSTQTLFQGTLADDQWTGGTAIGASALPVPVTNVMVPGDHKITGPAVDFGKLTRYMTNVLSRAGKSGTHTIVFGSGGARNVPEGFDRNEAKRQITEFLHMIGPLAQQNRVTVVVEPLNRKECNIINSVSEAMEYVRAVNHPNVQCLVDSYHMWLENEPESNVAEAIASIKHVHVADTEGRVPPGESKKANYRPLFAILKKVGYAGGISVEAGKFDIPAQGERVLQYLKQEWDRA